MKKLLFLLTIVFPGLVNVHAQAEKDSLIRVIAHTNVDTIKINALRDLSLLLSRNEPNEAEKYCKECISLSEKTGFSKGFIKCHNILGIINIYTSEYAEAISQFNMSLEKAREVNDQQAIFRVYNNLGSIYITLSDCDKAVNAFTNALSIAEKLGDKKSIAQCYSNIAIIQKDNKNFDNAMEYNKKAMEICLQLNDQMLLSNIYGNISTVNFLNKEYKDAIENCKKALTIKLTINDLYGAVINYANLGEYYLSTYINDRNKPLAIENLDSSLYYYNKTLELAVKNEDAQRECNAKLGLGKIAFIKNDYNKAQRLFEDVISLSTERGMIEIAMQAYSDLAEVNEAQGKYRQALRNFKEYKLISDSIYTSQNQNSINEMEVKYQTEQKQKEIELLNREKQISSIKTRFLTGLAVMLVMITVLIFIALYNNRKHNKLLILKNAEIYRQNQEIQEQSNNLSDAYHEISLQKELIEKSHLKITDSINYAQYIQSAAMPSAELLHNLLPNHFIMFKPRDVVSGDFYFAKKIHDKIFLAVADCTGHGVPGAFMSMLGMAILNELVRRPEITNAADLLNIMREQVKSSLQQKGEFGEQREGIDIALCIIREDIGELSFSGAYNPLWVFKKNNEFVEYRADRQPVGIYLKEKPFTEYKIALQQGDKLYLFSDGFYSQFGGENGEKLKIKRFQQMITEISILPLKKQHDALVKKYESWKGNEIQIDDILVVGIEV